MNHAGLPSLILPAVYATYRKSPDIEIEFACTVLTPAPAASGGQD